MKKPIEFAEGSWKRRLLGIGILLGGIVFYFVGPLLIIPGLPIAALALMTYLTVRVRRAAKWTQGTARVTNSDITVQHSRFSGEEGQATNKAALAYEFQVGAQTIQGSRISIGIGPEDGVTENLKKYPVGKQVPVFYNPANPTDCVLERKPPASLGCIWFGVIVAVLIYIGFFVFMDGGGPVLAEKVDAAFPQLHHPVVTIGAGLFALLCLGSFLWNKFNPRPEIAYQVTTGKIVSDDDGEDTTPGPRKRKRFSEVVVEFSYEVDGHEYHGTSSEPTGKQGSGPLAMEKHYPQGMQVDVYYDPANPIDSALEKPEPMHLDGRHSLVVGLIALAITVFAYYR